MCQLIWNLKMLGHLPGSSFPLCPVFLATTLRCTSCQRQQHVELRPRSKIKLFILYFNLLLKILATSQPYCFKLYICTDIDLMKHKYYEEKKIDWQLHKLFPDFTSTVLFTLYARNLFMGTRENLEHHANGPLICSTLTWLSPTSPPPRLLMAVTLWHNPSYHAFDVNGHVCTLVIMIMVRKHGCMPVDTPMSDVVHNC